MSRGLGDVYKRQELEYEYLDPDGEQYEIQYDNQVQKAIEVLSEKTQND